MRDSLGGKVWESVGDKGRNVNGSLDDNFFTSQFPERLVRGAACKGSVGEGRGLTEG